MGKFTKGYWPITESSWVEDSWDINMGDHNAAATVVVECDFGPDSESLKANAHLMYEMLNDIAISMECEHGVDTNAIFELLAKARGEKNV